jgi:hypothetical protein
MEWLNLEGIGDILKRFTTFVFKKNALSRLNLATTPTIEMIRMARE